VGEVIRFGGGRGAATGYFSATLPRAGPGVLVLHGAPGMTAEVMALADRLTSDERFSVLVPDLYAGAVPCDPAEADRLEAGLDPRRVSAILRDAAEHLTLNWHPRLGVVDLSARASRAREVAQAGTVETIVVFDVPGPEQEVSDAPVLVLADETPASAWRQMTDLLRHYLS